MMTDHAKYILIALGCFAVGVASSAFALDVMAPLVMPENYQFNHVPGHMRLLYVLAYIPSMAFCMAGCVALIEARRQARAGERHSRKGRRAA